jgi:hypothetical protein
MLHRNNVHPRDIAMQEPASRSTVLSLNNERAARRLGWTAESPITWREFLEQYPYQAAELRATATAPLSSAA